MLGLALLQHRALYGDVKARPLSLTAGPVPQMVTVIAYSAVAFETCISAS